MSKFGEYFVAQKKSPIKAGDGKPSGRYKFFNSSNVQTKFYDDYLFDKPALIFGTGGNASVHYCTDPFATSTDCIVFYAKNDSINMEMVYQYLSGNIELLEAGFKGASIKHISRAYIEEIDIPIIPKEKQRSIVTSLNQATQTIDLCNAILEKLDLLVKARFVEMFGDPVENPMKWNTISLDEACSSIVDCPHSTPNYTDENTGFMCIRTSIVKKNNILWDKIEYISEEEYFQRIKRRKPQKGDIVYTREGAILGIAAIIDRECKVALGQRSMLLSPDNRYCLPEFICNAMNFDSFFRRVTQGVSGSASPHINVADIKAFRIMMPPLGLQNQFAAFVEKTDRTKAAVKQVLAKAETLKKALMQEYFG